MEKYVWVNINTGSVSDSWNSKMQQKYLDKNDIASMQGSGWKLIKFECLNDPKFEFNSRMKIK